jgi:hypothetical protein
VRNQPIYMGLTLSDPVASVIGQSLNGGAIEIFAAFTSEGGLEYHLRARVLPYLAQNAPWAQSSWERLIGCYDENMDLQARYRFHEIIERVLGGNWEPAAPWEARRESNDGVVFKGAILHVSAHTPSQS